MSRIIDAFTQYLDDAGDPLANGFIRFLESGTNNTDKNTYADINETIPNANPVPLSGAGRVPNVFGTGSYSAILYTSAMVQIAQFDPVGQASVDGAFSDWNSQEAYSAGDIVVVDGDYYKSIINSNENNAPASSPSSWEQIKFIGVWNTNVSYSINDMAQDSSGGIYVSLTNSNAGNDPALDDVNWSKVATTAFTTAYVDQAIMPYISVSKLFHAQDQKVANTSGGTFTSGAWQTRDINAIELNTIAGASLSANQITLAAGEYYVEASAHTHRVNRNVLKLRNMSDSTDAVVGGASYTANSFSGEGFSKLSGIVDIPSEKVFEIQHRCETTHVTRGLGIEGNFGVAEIYLDIKIWRVS